MPRAGRGLGSLLVAGIVVSLVAMAATTTLTLVRNDRQHDGVRGDIALADAYDRARFASSDASAAAFQLGLTSDPITVAQLSDRIRADITSVSMAAVDIRAHGDDSDRMLIESLQSSHLPTAQTALTSLGGASVPEASTAAAGEAPEMSVTPPLLAALFQKADQRNREAVLALDDYSANLRRMAWITVAIDAGCLLAAALLGGLLRAHVSRETNAERRRQHSEKDAVLRGQRRFRSLAQNASDLVAVTDAGGRLRYVSPSVTRMLGYEVGDVRNVALSDVVHPEDRQGLLAQLKAAGAHPGIHPVPHVARIRHADGHWVYLETAVNNLLADPDIEGIVLNARDVTERVRAAEEQQRLVSVMELTSDGVVITDSHGRLLHLNRVARNWLGITASMPVDGRQSLGDLIPPSAYEKIAREALPLAILRGSWLGEIEFPDLDQRDVVLEIELLVHRTRDGGVDYIAALGRDVTEKRRSEAQLVELATRDPLTGLFNRRRFEEELATELTTLQASHGCGAVLFLDLDNFKSVNDSLGHSAGDDLVRALARILEVTLPAGAVTARLGGDEFATLVRDVTAEQAMAIADAVRMAVREHRMLLGGEFISTTTSIGVALLPGHGWDVDTLMANVDVAMYVAKRDRDACSLYAPTDDSRSTLADHAWEQRLRRALEEDEFELLAQPIFAAGGSCLGYELLLRLREPDGRMVLPADFLPIAERSSLITRIDRWVLGRAIEVAGRLHDGGGLAIAVNISGRTLRDASIPTAVMEQIRTAGVDPSRFIIEVTETAAMADVAEAQRFIQPLRDFGIHFAVDDFGAGYASFTCLRNLPVDRIKIDGSFIRGITRDPANHHLVQAIVEAAHGLGKTATAEFVEDERTLDILRGLGVDHMQGYHLGPPQGLAEILRPGDAVEAGERAA